MWENKQVVGITDEMITKVEKKINAKCDFIDWRYWLYYFDNGMILDTEEMLEAIYPNK